MNNKIIANQVSVTDNTLKTRTDSNDVQKIETSWERLKKQASQIKIETVSIVGSPIEIATIKAILKTLFPNTTINTVEAANFYTNATNQGFQLELAKNNQIVFISVKPSPQQKEMLEAVLQLSSKINVITYSQQQKGYLVNTLNGLVGVQTTGHIIFEGGYPLGVFAGGQNTTVDSYYSVAQKLLEIIQTLAE
ncbi:MAG: hypothetical protein PHF25_01175 [Candidatus Margulisbacteria bacterium]|nr:hypothetical protein [Candidatus Margulisiibacteriota bacterium]